MFSHLHVETSEHEASHPTSHGFHLPQDAQFCKFFQETQKYRAAGELHVQKKISNQRCFLLRWSVFKGEKSAIGMMFLFHVSILNKKFFGVPESPKQSRSAYAFPCFFWLHFCSPCKLADLLHLFIVFWRFSIQTEASKMHDESTRFSHFWRFIVTYFSRKWSQPLVFSHPRGFFCSSLSWFLFCLKDAPKIRRIPGLLRFVGQFRFCLCDLLLIEV